MSLRACKALKDNGESCRQSPLLDKDYCFWHDPENATEAAEARRLGGLRRRREKTLAGAYDIDGLDSIPKIRRLVEIAALDAVGLENSLGRARTIGYLAQVAASLLEKGESEERLAALEAALGPRLLKKRR